MTTRSARPVRGMTSIRALHEAADKAKAEQDTLADDWSDQGRAAYWVARRAYVAAAGEASAAALELWHAARAFVNPQWDEPHTPRYDALIAAALACHATETEATP